MRLIYIAGPYRAEHAWQVANNIHRAREVARQVWANGDAALCPHLNSAHFDGVCDDENFLRGGHAMLPACMGVVLVEGWERSSGTFKEINLAQLLKIPVYGMIDHYVNNYPTTPSKLLDKFEL